MKAFVGTWKLAKLALRLDRIKLPVWILSIVGLMGASGGALSNLYGTHEAQVQYAATTASSMVGRAFGGLVNGASLGSVTMVELFNFTAVLMAFMSTLLVVRHTRKPEETGAGELIGSGIVGRYASLTAAMLVAILANVIVGVFMWLILANVDGLSSVGALGFSAALAFTGIAFAGIAGIAAQLSETSRGANSIAGSVIGVAFVLRAIGDGFGKVSADGLSASPIWPTWLSPFGWGFQIHPFTDQNWWVFSLLIVFMIVVVISSFVILRHRDVGLGIIPSRAGRARAKQSLLSFFGLSWRLQKGVLIGWSIGMLVFGLIAGGMAYEFSDLISNNPEAAEVFGEIGGGESSFTDTFFGVMFAFAGITTSGYIAQALTRIRSEETSGHLESLLGTALSKTKWLVSHLLITVIGGAFLLLIMGTSAGIVHVIISGVPAREVARLIGASFSYMPALMVFGAFVIMLFGIVPRATIGGAWGGFIGGFFILQLAVLLKLPEWVLNISPFTHIPATPAATIPISTIIIMSAVALGLLVVGFVGFWRRDITTTA